jgi:hypothetical protein
VTDKVYTGPNPTKALYRRLIFAVCFVAVIAILSPFIGIIKKKIGPIKCLKRKESSKAEVSSRASEYKEPVRA